MVILIVNAYGEDLYLHSLGIMGSKAVELLAEVCCWWSRSDEDPLNQTPHFSCISNLCRVGRELSISEYPAPLTSALGTDKSLVSCMSKRFHHRHCELPRNFMVVLNSVKEAEKN